jgi:NitT/TauT family transport system substrate-binding protein
MRESRSPRSSGPVVPARARPRGRLAAAAALALAVLGVAGCGSGSGSSSPSAAASTAETALEQPDITVAAIQSVTAAGLYIAQQRGFFADAGLHVTIAPVTGGSSAIPNLAAGHVQVVFGNYVSDILAQAHGVASLRFLAAGNVSGPREQEVVVLPGSPITSPGGLRGKTIGVNALNNVGTMMIQAVLSRYGIPASAVHFVDIPFPSVAEALAAHRIDAAYISDPFLTAARQKYGVTTLFDCDQGTVANLPISGYVTTGSWAARNPRTAAAFVRALERGQALAGSDRAAVNSALAAYAGIPLKSAALAAIGTFPVSQQVQAAPLQRLADLMLRYGLLKQPVDVTPMTQ